MQGWRRKEGRNEKHREVSQRDLSFFHTVWCEQIHFRCHSLLFLCVCVSVCMCVCAGVQVASSPRKRNAIVDPFFQIGFPNLELCAVTVVSQERAVSLVLLSL